MTYVKIGRSCCPDACEANGKRHIKPSEICRVGVDRGYEVGLRDKSFAIQRKDAPRGSSPKLYNKEEAIALFFRCDVCGDSFTAPELCHHTGRCFRCCDHCQAPAKTKRRG